MVGPKYRHPVVDTPATFKSPSPPGAPAELQQDWWRLFQDADLDRLIDTANVSNQTVRQAVAAFDQARAMARIAGSFRYPTITLPGTYTRERTSANRESIITGTPV